MGYLSTLDGVARQLVTGSSEAGVLAVLGIVAATGIALGSVAIRGVKLGIAGVLFTGIIFAHLCWKDGPMERILQPTLAVSPAVLPGAAPAPADSASRAALMALSEPAGVLTNAVSAEVHRIKDKRQELLLFLREFGLILFVYTIGLQVGPGFLASLRSHGLRWNLFAGGIVVGGVAIAVALVKWGGVAPAAAVGLLSGAVTNTPGLAAAQQALKDLHSSDQALAGIGYAVAYPFGVVGIIFSMLALRVLFRLDPQRELQAFTAAQGTAAGPANTNVLISNPGVVGRTVDDLLGLVDGRVVISRLLRDGKVLVPAGTDVLRHGDTLHAVGTTTDLERFQAVAGERSSTDLRQLSKDLVVKRLIVTGKGIIGRAIVELDLDATYGVTVTRLLRAEVELVATPGQRLQFGDTIVVVGSGDRLAAVEALVGNSVRALEHPHLIPLFFGIMLGVLLGSIPVFIPGIPAPVKLGLAGGPLVVALLLSRVGRLGPLNFYMPHSANIMLREFGIVLFLACVGLLAGDRFVDTLAHGDGLRWMAYGAAITILPLLCVAILARLFTGMNAIPLWGLMAGAMTDPPALAFANASAGNESPAVAYAAVYPLTMLLRVVSAQVFVIVMAS